MRLLQRDSVVHASIPERGGHEIRLRGALGDAHEGLQKADRA